MAYDSLKSLVRQYIKTNAENEITGQILQNVLITMIDELGSEYSIEGIATPSTNPGSPSGKAMYFASQAGTYTYFDGDTLPLGIHLLVYNGTSWSHQTFFAVDATPTSGSNNFISSGAVFDALKKDGGAYDVTAHNNGATFASLQALLSDANLSTYIPTTVRKGGMSIKFVQTSDNKYVQYRYMEADATTAETFTNVANWQGVDDEPTAGSDNLVKSKGIYLKINQEKQRAEASEQHLQESVDSVKEETLEENREMVNSILENYAPVEIIGDVDNAADEEDLTSVNVEGTNVLKFKDKVYNPLVYSGLGRKILRKNIVDGVNTLTQSMINQVNTIYVIQYDFNLGGENITVPANCVLEFDGGSITNGTLNGTGVIGEVGKLSWFKQSSYDSAILAFLCNHYEKVDIDRNITLTSPIAINKELELYSSNGSIITINCFAENVYGAGAWVYNTRTSISSIHVHDLVIDFENKQYPLIVDNELKQSVFFRFTANVLNVNVKRIQFKNYFSYTSGGEIDSFACIRCDKGDDNTIDIQQCDFMDIYIVGHSDYATGNSGLGGAIRIVADTQLDTEDLHSCVSISLCHFENIMNIKTDGTPDKDDCDAIYVYGIITSDGQTLKRKIQTSIRDCKFVNVGKRCIKVQTGNVIIDGISVILDSDKVKVDNIIQTFGHNCTIRDIRILLNLSYIPGSIIFVSRGNNCSIENAVIENIGDREKAFLPLAVCSGTSIRNCYIKNCRTPFAIYQQVLSDYDSSLEQSNITTFDNCKFDGCISTGTFTTNDDFTSVSLNNCEWVNSDAHLQQPSILNNCVFRTLSTVDHEYIDKALLVGKKININNCKFYIHPDVLDGNKVTRAIRNSSDAESELIIRNIKIVNGSKFADIVGVSQAKKVVIDTISIEAGVVIGTSIITEFSTASSDIIVKNVSKPDNDCPNFITLQQNVRHDIITENCKIVKVRMGNSANECKTNVYVSKNESIATTGTSGFKTYIVQLSGPNSERPKILDTNRVGYCYYDTTYNTPVYAQAIANDGTVTWKNAIGDSVGTTYPIVLGNTVTGNLVKFDDKNLRDAGIAPQV